MSQCTVWKDITNAQCLQCHTLKCFPVSLRCNVFVWVSAQNTETGQVLLRFIAVLNNKKHDNCGLLSTWRNANSAYFLSL